MEILDFKFEATVFLILFKFGKLSLGIAGKLGRLGIAGKLGRLGIAGKLGRLGIAGKLGIDIFKTGKTPDNFGKVKDGIFGIGDFTETFFKELKYFDAFGIFILEMSTLLDIGLSLSDIFGTLILGTDGKLGRFGTDGKLGRFGTDGKLGRFGTDGKLGSLGTDGKFESIDILF